MRLLLVFIGCAVASVSGLCCPWHPTADLKCACNDGGLVHPWECCSKGSCNVFCCNCDGKCRVNTTLPMDELPEDLLADEQEEQDWDFLLTADKMLPRVQIMGRDKREVPVSGLEGTKMKFDMLDVDKSGDLSLNEVVRIFGDESDESVDMSKAVLEDLDIDGDGLIQPNEFDKDLLDY